MLKSYDVVRGTAAEVVAAFRRRLVPRPCWLKVGARDDDEWRHQPQRISRLGETDYRGIGWELVLRTLETRNQNLPDTFLDITLPHWRHRSDSTPLY